MEAYETVVMSSSFKCCQSKTYVNVIRWQNGAAAAAIL
jgi:hypothetical protein